MYSAQEIRKLAKIIRKIPMGLVITAGEGQIEYANSFIVKTIGLTRREIIGRRFSEFRPKDAARTLTELEQTLSTGELWQGETQILKKTGEIFHALESVDKMYDPHSRITRYVHFLLDISGQKRAAVVRRLAFYDSPTGAAQSPADLSKGLTAPSSALNVIKLLFT